MGCDIHIYPEYWAVDDLDCDKKILTHSICGEYSVGRCYDLFDIMAGVRGAGNNMITSPRGLPAGDEDEPPLGWDAEHALTITVVPDHEIKGDNGWGEKEVAQSIVDSWGNNTGIFSSSVRPYKTYDMRDGTKREVILHPDYHSISWLTLKELLEVRKRYLMEQVEFSYEQYDLKKKDTKQYRKILKEVQDPEQLLNHNFGPFEYTSLNGLIGMLYFIEKSHPGIKSRIVFWFDS